MQLNNFKSELSAPVPIPSKPAFKFFAACEDEAAAEKVAEVQNQIGAQFGDGVEFLNDFRNLAEFRSEESRKILMADAMDADIIVISMSGRNRLAEELKLWIEGVPATENRQTALVTLFDPTAATWEQQRQIGYFREIAENNGWDFFSNVEEVRRESAPEPLFEKLDVVPLDESDYFHISSIWENWGIND